MRISQEMFATLQGGIFRDIHKGVFTVYLITSGNIPIYKISVTISAEQEEPSGYWGWWDKQADDFSMIFPHKFLACMCFAEGVEEAERQGRGKLLRFDIKPLGVFIKKGE